MITWFKQLYARFIRWFGDGSLISNPKVGFNGCATVQQAPEKPTLTYGEPTLVSTLYPNAEDITLELSFTNHMYMLTPEALHVSGRFPEGNSTWAIVDEEMNGRPSAFEVECIASLVVKNEDSSVVVFSTRDDHEGACMTSPDDVSKPHEYPWVIKRDPEQVLPDELEEVCESHRAYIRKITIEDYPWAVGSKPGVTCEGVDRMVCVYLYYEEYELARAQEAIDNKRKQAQAKESLHNFINGSEA